MTRDEILYLAEQVGCGWARAGTEPVLIHAEKIVAFATLVASAEREVCAKGIEDSTDGMSGIGEWSEGYLQAAKDIAAGIRARGDE